MVMGCWESRISIGVEDTTTVNKTFHGINSTENNDDHSVVENLEHINMEEIVSENCSNGGFSSLKGMSNSVIHRRNPDVSTLQAVNDIGMATSSIINT